MQDISLLLMLCEARSFRYPLTPVAIEDVAAERMTIREIGMVEICAGIVDHSDLFHHTP